MSTLKLYKGYNNPPNSLWSVGACLGWPAIALLHEVRFKFFRTLWSISPSNSQLCMEKMGTDDRSLEEFFEEKKRVRNPFVPVGAFITAGVLTAGLISFRQGNSHLGQKLMRARVVAQGATVALMVGTAYYYGENPWQSS